MSENPLVRGGRRSQGVEGELKGVEGGPPACPVCLHTWVPAVDRTGKPGGGQLACHEDGEFQLIGEIGQLGHHYKRRPSVKYVTRSGDRRQLITTTRIAGGLH